MAIVHPSQCMSWWDEADDKLKCVTPLLLGTQCWDSAGCAVDPLADLAYVVVKHNTRGVYA